MDRTCPRCRELKPIEAFRLKGSGRREVYCEPCKRAYDVDYYERTKARRQERKRENIGAIRERNRQALWDYLAGKTCQDCGEADTIVLEFDHRDQAEKTANIADLVGWGFSLARLRAELKLCDVVCCNCHRRRTARQLGWAKGFAR